jgi:competence protein ComEA
MRKKILIGIAIIVMIGIGIIINNMNHKEVKVNEAPQTIIEEKERILVQISGEVIRPGIYEMNNSDRINDVVNICGGFTKKADFDNINLVAKVSDGMIIVIKAKANNETEIIIPKLISINNDSLTELMSLSGIGEAKAKSIITYRELNGGFKSLDDLLNVNGISNTIFENIKNNICL